MQHIFIVGSKGIPGRYGGYETFVDRLTECHQLSSDITYYVACKSETEGMFEYHGAHCIKIKVPNVGPAQAVLYDVSALHRIIRLIREQHIEHPIVYVLACRIGPFAGYFHRLIGQLGGVLYVNPDGHEWQRKKWSLPIRKYWKLSERLMVKHCDLLVCDSQAIERYIREEYALYSPKTVYISYGAQVPSTTDVAESVDLDSWFETHGLSSKSYYLAVGRLVPENNYEIILREFMNTSTKRDLVLITTADEKLLYKLGSRTGFGDDSRIKFVGTVYDPALLSAIRRNAYGYIHGHEVGGTNPSLLEALACTDINLVLDVDFNREVSEDAALYWTRAEGSLAAAIDRAEGLTREEVEELSSSAKSRIVSSYSWKLIAKKYEALFLHGENVARGFHA